MDNVIFDVNGRTKEQLIATIKLILLDEYGKNRTVKGWRYDEKKGFVLLWYVQENGHSFPEELNAEETANIVWDWLHSKEAESVPRSQWEKNIKHDGSNEPGFRVYVEEWGHVKNSEHTIDHYSICAIKKVYCWYGK